MYQLQYAYKLLLFAMTVFHAIIIHMYIRTMYLPYVRMSPHTRRFLVANMHASVQSPIHPLHAVQFVTCHCKLYSLLIVVKCRTVCCRLPYSQLFVAACNVIPYLLSHAVQFFLHAMQLATYVCILQFAICCCMPYSLLFVVACLTICYLLPHAVQFVICCRMPYNLVLAATCHIVC